jgi:hypothetical protein
MAAVRETASPLTGTDGDYEPLIDRIGEARFALLGEASHGTHEFYCERAEITKRLIAEKNFAAVAVEADWPDAYRLNRYVRGASDDVDAEEALADFRRFPTGKGRPRGGLAGARALLLLRSCRRGYPDLWSYDPLEPFRVVRRGGRRPIARVATPGG